MRYDREDMEAMDEYEEWEEMDESDEDNAREEYRAIREKIMDEMDSGIRDIEL